VAQAVVVARSTSADAEPALVAYVVPTAAEDATSDAERATSHALRCFLADQLPDFLVPSVIVLLAGLPMSPSGKVDRASLPEPADQSPTSEISAPESETEAALAGIWREILKRDRIGVTDDFLALGGHSLLAIRILGKISRSLGVRLPMRAIFDEPTVRRLARLVDKTRGSAAIASIP